MDIHIENNNAGESVFNGYRTLLNHWMRRYFIWHSMTLIFGVVLLISGINEKPDISSKSETYEEDSKTYITNTSNKTYNVSFGFGIVLTLIGTWQIIKISRLQSLAIRHANANRQKHVRSGNKLSIHLDNESLRYEDFETNSNTRWSAFTNYLIKGKCIFLFPNPLNWSAVLIDFNHNPDSDFIEFRKFIQAKLPLRQ